MKVKGFAISGLILAIVGCVLLTIASFNPEAYWIRDCATLCIVLMDVCLIIECVKSKDPDKKISTKKIVLGIVLGAVLTIAAIWIILISILTGTLE